jgi:hypothetical protein
VNAELTISLDDAVQEVLGDLTGLDLTYRPELDRYRAVTRQLNRALRANALEHEWSYYSAMRSVGSAGPGERQVFLPSSVRPRIVGDDAVVLYDGDGVPRVWAYVLPRDAGHKYYSMSGLWCTVTRNVITFSRPLTEYEGNLDIQVPVMREPRMFRLPDQPEDPDEPLVLVDQEIRDQQIDFEYPDVIVMRAAFFYAQTDPVMQPRVQTLEALYKDLMYQVIERDERNTDTPYQNDFRLDIRSGITPEPFEGHGHPHSDAHPRR